VPNQLYPKVKEHFLTGNVIMITHDIRVICVDLADYTFSSAHTTLADVPSGARVAVSPALTGKTAVGGVFDATDTSIPGVTGDEFESLVMYRHTGLETAPLVAFIDTFTAGSPLTPTGGSVDIIWHASGIFAL
jgi:hypothetical protein